MNPHIVSDGVVHFPRGRGDQRGARAHRVGARGVARGRRSSRRSPASGAVSTDDDEIGWDPDAGRIDAPALEGRRRGRAPRGRGHRRTEVDRRTEAAHPRQPGARHRRCSSAAIASRERKPKRVRVGFGDRLLRRSRRRGPHREERTGRRLPRRRVPSVGSRDATRGRRRRPHRARAHRHRAREARRRAQVAC